MLSPPTLTIYLGLVTLFVSAVPLGATLLRCGEWLLGRRLTLALLERILASFYGAGSLLFVLASIPLPIFTAELVFGLLSVGAVALILFWWRERWASLRFLRRHLGNVPTLVVGLGTLGLLAFEVAYGTFPPLPNAFDGSVQTLYAQLLILHHTIPSTLAPYASAGVVYPQATAVWLALPSMLFGWPVAVSPLLLTPLFLALSVPSAYCLGARLERTEELRPSRCGLVFAGGFGLLVSWPRFFVGSSYDFAFGLALFLVASGWLLQLGRKIRWSWRETVGVGLLLGSASALSVTVGETLLLLLFASLLVYQLGWNRVRIWLPRYVTAVAISILFLARSLILFGVWYSYPGHVLRPTGAPPYAPTAPINGPLNFQGVVGLLDPFVSWKWKLSPIPALSFEIGVLLAVGLVLVFLRYLRPNAGVLARALPTRLTTPLVLTLLVTFLTTVVIIVSQVPGLGLSFLTSLTSVSEMSFLLFVAFELLALTPLVAAAEYLWPPEKPDAPPAADPKPAESSSSASRPVARTRTRGRPRRGRTALAVAVLLVPLATGAGFTALDGPGVLHAGISPLANATTGDVEALEWAGAHLPSCSHVLVALGSAALFLPEFANVQLVYPMLPYSVNFSYHLVIQSLTQGFYNRSVRSALLSLDITEVFATGATFTGYPQFNVSALNSSSDFSELFASDDAFIFEFLPGATLLDCPASM